MSSCSKCRKQNHQLENQPLGSEKDTNEGTKIQYWNQNLRLPIQYTVNTYTPPPLFFLGKKEEKGGVKAEGS